MQPLSSAVTQQERQPPLRRSNRSHTAADSTAQLKKQEPITKSASAATAGDLIATPAANGKEALAPPTASNIAIPSGRTTCDICVSSPYETAASKAAKYAPFMLKKHKRQHHCTRVSFTTWLLHHHKEAKCYTCPVCEKASTQHLQLHILQAHWADVPTQLPAGVFRLAYDACVISPKTFTRSTALKYRTVIEELEAATVGEEEGADQASGQQG